MSTASALLRFSARCCLYLLIAAVALVAVPAHWLGFAGLWVIEKLASRANELRTGGRL